MNRKNKKNKVSFQYFGEQDFRSLRKTGQIGIMALRPFEWEEEPRALRKSPLFFEKIRWHRALIMILCGLSQNRRGWQILVVWFLYSLIGNGVYADDYFDRITAASNGRLTRFQQDVIMVHAEVVPLDNNLAEVYQHTLTQSLELWREVMCAI